MIADPAQEYPLAWEQARLLDDAQAAEALATFYVTRWFPQTPPHEAFAAKFVLEEVAFLDAGQAERAIRWLEEYLAGRPKWRAAFEGEAEIPGPEFAARMREWVAPWAQVRGDAARFKTGHSLRDEAGQRLRACQAPTGDDLRTLLALSVADVSAAARVLRTWPRTAWAPPWALADIALRMWRRNRSRALRWMLDLPARVPAAALFVTIRQAAASPDVQAGHTLCQLLNLLAAQSDIALLMGMERLEGVRDWPDDERGAVREHAASLLEATVGIKSGAFADTWERSAAVVEALG